MSELSQLSCGHSCIVARPEGMATNGGCHCLDDIKDHDQRRRLHKAFILYRAEITDARRAVGEGWFAGGVSLAEAIERKCSFLEGVVTKLDTSDRQEPRRG